MGSTLNLPFPYSAPFHPLGQKKKEREKTQAGPWVLWPCLPSPASSGLSPREGPPYCGRRAHPAPGPAAFPESFPAPASP